MPTVKVRMGKDIAGTWRRACRRISVATACFLFPNYMIFSEGNNNEQKGIQRKEHDRDCGHVGGIVYIDAA